MKTFNKIEDPDGNIYEVETDETLEREGIPADAATVGKKIKEVLTKTMQLAPEFANSIDECTDTSKLYVLPDGYLYAFQKGVVEGGLVNKIDEAGYIDNKRLSTSGSGELKDAIGYVSTGMIDFPQYTLPVKIMISGIDMAKEYGAVVTYRANGDVFASYLQPFQGIALEVVDTENAVLTINNLINYTAIRLCGYGLGKNLVVNINGEKTESTYDYSWKNTGHAFVPASYEERIISLENETKNIKAEVENIKNNNDSNDVEEYVRTEADAVVDKIFNVMGDVNIAFLSDIHYNPQNHTATLHAAQAVELMDKTVGLDAVILGGDYTDNGMTTAKEEVKTDIKTIRSLFNGSIWLRGNHDIHPFQDADGNDVRLTRTELFHRVGKSNLNHPGYKANVNDLEGNYGYFDIENKRVRIICINTSDNDSFGTHSPESGQTYQALLDAYNVAVPQLQWLADNALDFSGKEEPTEWKFIVFSHVPICNSNSWYSNHSYTDKNGTTWGCNVGNVKEMILAYKNGERWSAEHNGETASKDFSQSDKRAEFVCNIAGHFHAEKLFQVDNMLALTVPCVYPYGTRESDDGQTHSKISGTAEETSFNVVSFDFVNRKIYAWNYGAGYDREISY